MTTTTAMKLGCKFCETCLRDGWGDATEDEIDKLAAAVGAEFDRRAREVTGDDSLSWLPHTSELLYDCRGQSDGVKGRCFEPLVTWPGDVDFEAILDSVNEWAMDHWTEIVGPLD